MFYAACELSFRYTYC